MNLPPLQSQEKPRCHEIKSSRAFERKLRDHHRKLVVVQWMAPWAEPCRKIRTFYESLAVKFPRSTFLIVNADERKKLSEKYEVESVPTFMFFHEHNKLEIETFTGAEEAKLEEAVGRLNELYSPWCGKGHSLIDAETPRHRNGRVRHHNPWANPGWVPPGMRDDDEPASPLTSPTSRAVFLNPRRRAAKSPTAGSNNSLSSNGWAPQAGTHTTQDESNGASNEETEDEHLLHAIHRSLDICTQVISDLPRGVGGGNETPSSAEVSPRPRRSIHDESLLDKYNIDRDILEQLIQMGFPQVRCEKALLRTKTNDMDDALNWIDRHHGDSDIDEPLRPRGSRSRRSSVRRVSHSSRHSVPPPETDDLLERIRAQRRKYSSIEAEGRESESRRRSRSSRSGHTPRVTDLEAIDRRLLEMNGLREDRPRRRSSGRSKRSSRRLSSRSRKSAGRYDSTV